MKASLLAKAIYETAARFSRYILWSQIQKQFYSPRPLIHTRMMSLYTDARHLISVRLGTPPFQCSIQRKAQANQPHQQSSPHFQAPQQRTHPTMNRRVSENSNQRTTATLHPTTIPRRVPHHDYRTYTRDRNHQNRDHVPRHLNLLPRPPPPRRPPLERAPPPHRPDPHPARVRRVELPGDGAHESHVRRYGPARGAAEGRELGAGPDGERRGECCCRGI